MTLLVSALQVAKVIQKLASTSSVDVRESYMKPLELFVREHHEGLKVSGRGRVEWGKRSRWV